MNDSLHKKLNWTDGIHERLLSFLEGQQDLAVPGYFRYSLSGDLFDDKKKSNLAGSIFALKILYMLGEKDVDIITPIAERIISFQKSNGALYDPFVYRKSFARNALSSLLGGQFSNLNNHGYIRAETRQAYSALLLHDSIPERVFRTIPTRPQEINDYLTSLDWTRPWAAGSHFSHLMFFLALFKKHGDLKEDQYFEATRTALEIISSLQHSDDGAWYRGNPPKLEKINGAMKVITGLLWTEATLLCPRELIDLCLSDNESVHACDQINKALVLRYADEAVGSAYRREDILQWCRHTLDEWSEYYYPEYGGFSFWKHRANAQYYGARVTEGRNEPDIHGTVLFVWGLSMIAKLLPLPELDWLHQMKS